MSWVKLDDKFTENPKVEPISDAAFRLYVDVLCRCARNETDGLISAQVVKKSDPLLVEELTSAKLWTEDDSGFHVHDYLVYNPSKKKRNKTDPVDMDPSSPEPDPKEGEMVKKVFTYWQEQHGHPTSRLDAKRDSRIRARFDDGFTVRDLCLAIKGAKKDEFLMGRDPKAARKYDGIENILRDAAQVERLMALTEDGSVNKPQPINAEYEARQKKRAEEIEAQTKKAKEEFMKNTGQNPQEVNIAEVLKQLTGSFG